MINIQRYAGVEGLPALLGDRLFRIHTDGSFMEMKQISDEFANELQACAKAYRTNPGAFFLATLVPGYVKDAAVPWRRSSTMVFGVRTLTSLKTFESAVSKMSYMTSSPTFPVDEEMSSYAGMRILSSFGRILGYRPVITLNGALKPIVINIRIPDVYRKSERFHDELEHIMLESGLYERGTDLTYIEEVMQQLDEKVMH